jgi:DNA repair exonuclease SbcCD nuclease subunit
VLSRAAFCNTEHYLVVPKVRERLAVNKQRSHIFYTESLNLRKLNEAEGKEQYGVEVSNRFATSEDMDAEFEY